MRLGISMSELKTDELLMLEASILRQEHRVFKLWSNYLTRKRTYADPEDPRRIAITKAFWLNLLFSSSLVYGSAGVCAFVTVLLLYWQNQMLQESLFPKPHYTAMIRPLVKATLAPSSTGESSFPDIGFSDRKVEAAFAANEAGSIYIDIVNLRLRYITSNNVVIYEQYFESKPNSNLPVVQKGSIQPTNLIFTESLPSKSKSISPEELIFPIHVEATFAFSAIDSASRIWSSNIVAELVVIKDGDSDIRSSDIYMTAPNDALRATFKLGQPAID